MGLTAVKHAGGDSRGRKTVTVRQKKEKTTLMALLAVENRRCEAVWQRVAVSHGSCEELTGCLGNVSGEMRPKWLEDYKKKVTYILDGQTGYVTS